MRIIPLLLLTLGAGCSSPPFFSGASDRGIPAEAVRSYAKAHGLSRDEARRELELYRDADYLKELRQEQSRPADPSPARAAGGAVAGK